MASANPFDLLGDNDNDDPSQLIASAHLQLQQHKAAAAAAVAAESGSQWGKIAKSPIKPLPPAQAEHTGVAWDPNTNEVNAPEEMWNHFYTINKFEYKIFRKEGFRHYGILREIFHGTLATGGLHNASTEQPPTSEEERIMEDEFLNKGTYVQLENDDAVSATPRSTNDIKQKRKEPKLKMSAQFSEAMTTWASSAAERSTKSSLRQEYLQRKLAKLKQNEDRMENDPYSIESCMKILNSMENISDDVYGAGSKAFADVNFRKIFMNMSEHRRGPVLDRL